MKDKIGNHNGKVLSKKSEVVLDENGNVIKCCSDQPNCPTKPDRCDHAGVIYQADVHAENKIMTYNGSTERQFKKRYSEHKSSFKKIPKCHTTLSSHIWRLKDKNISYKVKWSVKARGHAFSSGCRACDLCLTKKLIILTADQNTMLNRRDELLETCRHQRKHLFVLLFKRKIPPDSTIK